MNWSPTEKETYAIVACLWKWAGWIGCSPVEIVTDHKALEEWTTNNVLTPSGPTGRKARWHEILSQFNLSVVYKPGVSNIVADAMSRWAYPASTEREDVTIHGSAESAKEVKNMEKQFKAEIFSISHSHNYKLDPLARDQALIKLGADPSRIVVDLFASWKNAQHQFFIDKEMDAFAYNWSLLCDKQESLLWANPPFTQLEQVVTKAILENVSLALCAPVWPTHRWWN